ncbi:TetR/AcrR family transcriptional regulator [Salipaludibacillus aurantiacus]|uniref:DNA-binding transcriptional regulator, AcrR family n=1 Tax=Salipaludibacillus aurantiacus TaxID=1601833 RepID=A0A1H9TXY7_9BACI|nr:TetR/AcrR family transcriptional regulator [Salipaludibacillus aurantiacus]SES01623.1 DNA-binding transcriptional regulator, AcrR family [Salipaludibacillus aurantiacus]
MKEKILAKSIGLFEKKGFSETSIQDIVDVLGVTKGTFYYYFKSKEELLMDIHLRYISDIVEHQKKIIEDTGKDSRTKLFDIVYMLLKSIETQGASARVFFREMRHLSDKHLEEIIPKRDQFFDQLKAMIEEGMSKGEFRSDLRSDIVTFAVLGACNWSYQWFNPNGPVPDYEIAEIYLEIFLNGIHTK